MTEDIWVEKAEKWLWDSCGYAPDTSVKELAEWMKKSESCSVPLKVLIREMERIIETEQGIHMTNPMKEAIYSIVRDAWAAIMEAED